MDPALAKLGSSFAEKLAVPVFRVCVERLLGRARADAMASRYTQSLLERVAMCKTFLIYDRPRHLRRFYIPGKLLGPHGELKCDARQVLPKAQVIGVVGSAGSGKTLALRHLCLQCLEDNYALPVFIEFRSLFASQASPPTLMEAICEKLFGTREKSLMAQTNRILSSGKCVLYLDGFDEIPRQFRPQFQNDIVALSDRFQKCTIVVSTRPDSLITSLRQVYLLRPQPLTLQEAFEHVDRYDIDNELQESFKALLAERVFEQHRSYASNPLLLAVLFLTYRTHLHLHERPALMYDEVFDALCFRHDARKGGFRRELLSGLSQDVFIQFVELFSYVTLHEQAFAFTPPVLRKYIIDCLNALHLSTDSSLVADDLVQSISYLLDDDGEFVFIHRSLQEFMASKFILTNDSPLHYVGDVTQDVATSLAIRILHGIRPSLIENALILPLLVNFMAQFRGEGEYITLNKYLNIAYAHRQTASQAVIINDLALPKPWIGTIPYHDFEILLMDLFGVRSVRSHSSAIWWQNTPDGSSRSKFVADGERHFTEEGNLGQLSRVLEPNYESVCVFMQLYEELLVRRRSRVYASDGVAGLLRQLRARLENDRIFNS